MNMACHQKACIFSPPREGRNAYLMGLSFWLCLITAGFYHHDVCEHSSTGNAIFFPAYGWQVLLVSQVQQATGLMLPPHIYVA